MLRLVSYRFAFVILKQLNLFRFCLLGLSRIICIKFIFPSFIVVSQPFTRCTLKIYQIFLHTFARKARFQLALLIKMLSDYVCEYRINYRIYFVPICPTYKNLNKV